MTFFNQKTDNQVNAVIVGVSPPVIFPPFRQSRVQSPVTTTVVKYSNFQTENSTKMTQDKIDMSLDDIIAKTKTKGGGGRGGGQKRGGAGGGRGGGGARRGGGFRSRSRSAGKKLCPVYISSHIPPT